MEEFSSFPPLSSGKDEDVLVEVSGKMDGVPSITKSANGAPEFNTLDEPIKDTIMRDLKAVGSKFYHVLYPHSKSNLLTEWDLWGPLILCTYMAMLLQIRYSDDISSHDGGPEFAEVFIIVWVGSVAVTINTKLLGGNISFFQSVCVLGYCLLPLSIALTACRAILIVSQTTLLFIVRCLVCSGAFGWSVWAAVKFLGDCSPARRKALAVYPIGLFYFVLAWMVVSLTNS